MAFFLRFTFGKMRKMAVLLLGLAAGADSARAQTRQLHLEEGAWQVVLEDDFAGRGPGQAGCNAAGLDTTRWLTSPGGWTGPVLPQARYPFPLYRGWGSEWYGAPDPALLTVGQSAPAGSGVLTLTARRDSTFAANGLLFRSAMIRSRQPLRAYGVYEMRARLPSPSCWSWPTFWLVAAGGSEIDVIDGGSPGTVLNNVIDWRHGADPLLPSAQSKGYEYRPNVYFPGIGPPAPRPLTTLAEAFNTYTMVWTPEEVVFFFNKQEIFSVPRREVATHDQPTDLMINLQMYPRTSCDSARLEVDYVRVWQPRCPPPCLPGYAVPGQPPK